MRKLFAFIFLMIFVASAVVFFALLNFRASTNSSAGIKSAAAKSDINSIITSYVKDKIVSENNLNLDQGDLFEKLNEEVSNDFSKNLVNNTIDGVYGVIKNKNSDNKSVAVSFENSNLGYRFYREISLQDNIFILIYQKLWTMIAVFGLIAAISLGFMLQCLKNLHSRLNWSGSVLFLTSLILAGGFIFIKNLEPGYFETLIKSAAYFNDAKIINGFSKFILALFTEQSLLYYAESGVLLAVACFFWFTSGALRKEVIDKIDAIFFNEEPKKVLSKK